MPRALFNEEGRHIDWLQDFDPEPDGEGRINIGGDEDAPEFAFVENVDLDDPRVDQGIERRGVDFLREVEREALERIFNPAVDDGFRLAEPVEAEGFRRGAQFQGRLKENKEMNGPELWNFLLHNVREIYECEACIAGGAVRDYMLGIPPKDIDIFIDHNFPDIIERNMPELNFGHGHRKHDTEYEVNDPAIKGVWSLHVKGYSIDLIARPIPKDNYTDELLKTFDFDICKSAYLGNGEFIDYGAVDRVHKTFTFSIEDAKDEQYEHSKKRFDRFIRRTGMKDFKIKNMNRLEDILKAKQEAAEKKRKALEEMQKKLYSQTSTWKTSGFSAAGQMFKYYTK